MAKLTLVILVATLVVAAKGFPAFDNTLSTAAAAGNWDEVHRLLGNFYRQTNNWVQPQAQLQQLQQQTQNAVQDVQQRVQQQLAQQAAQLAQQPAAFAQQSGHLANGVGGGGGHVYEESESSFSNNNNGVVHSGGHKYINDNGKITEFDFTPQPAWG
nr:seroin 2 [Yponomeuta cagnagella]